MPGNLLEAIGLPPEWFKSVMGGVAQGIDQPEPEAAPQPQGLSPSWFQGVMGNQAQPGAPEPQISQTPVAQPPAAQGGLSPEWFDGVMKPEVSAMAPGPDGLTPDWFARTMGDDMPGGKPANLLEELTPGARVQYQAGAPSAAQAPGPAAPNAPEKPRRSLLSTVGQIADVLAKVGGAEALYQPTLDAREDRSMAKEDRQRGIDLDKLKMALTQQQVEGGNLDLANARTARLGLGIKGLQAIQARGGDPVKAWPVIAQQLGIEPERAKIIGDAIAADPNALYGLNAALGSGQQGQNFGLQPFFAKGPNGEVKAYQLGQDGTINPINLPEGYQPAGQVGVVDNGDANVVYDKRTGLPVRVMPKAGGPQEGQRPIVDARGRVIGYEEMPGSRTQYDRDHPKPAAGNARQQQDYEQRTAGTQAALANIGELRTIYGKLDEAGAMVNPNNSAVGNIGARVRSSGVGQMVEGAVGTEAQTMRDRVNSIRPGMMQAIAKATGMTGKQLDSNADVQLWMRTVTDPTSSYQANMAALDGLERFIRLNTPKAPAAGGGGPRRALPPRVGGGGGGPARPRPQPTTQRRAPPGLGARVNRPGKPTVSNW
jgi:hypothetical protein